MNAARYSPNRRAAKWFYDRGEEFYQTGRYRRAAGAFAKSIRRAPGSPMAHAGRGLSLAKLNRSQRAVRILERAMALADEAGLFDAPPWLPRAAYESGRAYEHLGQFYMALRCYTKALNFTTDSGTIAPHEILRRRGHVKLRIKEFEQALKDLDRSVARAPDSALAYFDRARVHEAMGNEAATVDDLRAYLRLAGPAHPHRTEALARIADLTQ
jgi:tetratricopeptide (TPR) repeat protein